MDTQKPGKILLAHSIIQLREDGIIQIDASDQVYHVFEIKEIHEAIAKISGNKRALLLLIASDFTSIDTEARKYLSTPEAGLYTIAEAYVIKSLAQRLIMNFLIRVNGTPVPVQFFTEANTATSWLFSFASDKKSA